MKKRKEDVVEDSRWVPTPSWDGRRWELFFGFRVVGRVVKFVNEVQASRYYPKYRMLEGSHSTLRAAALVLEKSCREEKA